MDENHSQPLISRAACFRRPSPHLRTALGLIGGSLAIAMTGYHFPEDLTWIDPLWCASRLLGGMGPVSARTADAGKLFASAYARYSGAVFLVIAGVIIAPAFHHVLHHFHVELESGDSAEQPGSENQTAGLHNKPGDSKNNSKGATPVYSPGPSSPQVAR